MLDLISNLGTELEVIAFIINRPGTVRIHVDAVISIGNQIIKFPGAGLQANIDHANDRHTVPARGTHASV